MTDYETLVSRLTVEFETMESLGFQTERTTSDESTPVFRLRAESERFVVETVVWEATGNAYQAIISLEPDSDGFIYEKPEMSWRGRSFESVFGEFFETVRELEKGGRTL